MWRLVLALFPIVLGQSSRGLASPFIDPSSCRDSEFFAPHNYSCVACPSGLVSSSDNTSCQCPPNSIIFNYTALGPNCSPCPQGEVVISDRCVACPSGSCTCSESQILGQNGCVSCPNSTVPNSDKTRCVSCQSLSCLCQNGFCVQGQGEPKTEVWLSDGGSIRSIFIEEEIREVSGRCQLGSSIDCQALLNMCVLQHFDRSSSTACSLGDRFIPQLMPLLILDGDIDSELRKESSIRKAYSMGEGFDILVGVFHQNGSFSKLIPLPSAEFLCPFPEKSIIMGRRFNQNCPLEVEDLMSGNRQLFMELFVRFQDENGDRRIYPISIMNKQMRGNGQYINKENSNRRQLVRRLFLVDNSSRYPNGTSILRFVSSMELQIYLQPSRDGSIFPPLLIVDYSEAGESRTTVESSFSVVFISDPDRHDRDLEITMSVLCPSSLIWAGLKTYSWGRRSGKQLISDGSVVIQFLLFSAACLGEVFFLVFPLYFLYDLAIQIPSLIAIWLTFAYKTQYYVFYNTLSASQEGTLRIYLLFAVILKAAGVVQKIWQLVRQQTIFIDWERPRTVVDQSTRPASQDISKSLKEFPPVAWRTYMVANEWNELFSYRKTSITLQLLTILIFLEHFGWKYWALAEPGFHTSQQGSVEVTNLTRFGVYVFVYFGFAFVQWIIQVLLLERLILDPFHNFIDLCSVANISVLSLTHALYGYYVHGRSVHGKGDVSMGEMNDFLKRERDNLVANRGLEPGMELQTFQVALPANFKDKLNDIHNSNSVNSNLRGFDQFSAKMDIITQKHEMVNSLAKEFIDHSLNDIDYTTRDPTFVESLLDVETNDTTVTGHFTRDPSEMSFTCCFLYGNEWIFLSFEAALFCSLALWLDSITLTCFLVFLVTSSTRLFCSFIAKSQLARMSLVDNRFLL